MFGIDIAKIMESEKFITLSKFMEVPITVKERKIIDVEVETEVVGQSQKVLFHYLHLVFILHQKLHFWEGKGENQH